MRFIPLFAASAVLLLAGCSTVEKSSPPPQATRLQAGTDVSEQELMKTGEAFFHQIEKALREKNHAEFVALYVNEHKHRITKPVFEQMSASFCASNGKLKQFRYIGTVNKYSSRILLLGAVFERTPQVNEQLKKAGYDPAAIPDTESLVQMILGKTDQGWKIIQMGIL